MLSNIQKTIIIRATRIRMAAGEEPDAIVASYTKLTEEERTEILAAVRDFL